MSRNRNLADLINGIDASKITSGSIALARLGNVDLTNLNASNLTSGTVPSARISGLPSGVGGKLVGVSFANPSNYSTTLTYSSTSLTPCCEITHTAVANNSHFIIKWSAVHGRSGAGRSQLLFSKSYTAGQNNYANNNYLFYDHYGLYITGSNHKNTTGYSYYDNSTSISAGATVTYYVFLGVIGSGTDSAENQRIQVMEIAQ